jgi:hypothetical protein
LGLRDPGGAVAEVEFAELVSGWRKGVGRLLGVQLDPEDTFH